MRIKATIVAYAFSVQCFEKATVVAYAGLRIKVYEICVVYDNNSKFGAIGFSINPMS